MARIIAAGDVGHLVKNGATVYCTGMGLAGFAEEAVKAIRESFNATGHPRASASTVTRSGRSA